MKTKAANQKIISVLCNKFLSGNGSLIEFPGAEDLAGYAVIATLDIKTIKYNEDTESFVIIFKDGGSVTAQADQFCFLLREALPELTQNEWQALLAWCKPGSDVNWNDYPALAQKTNSMSMLEKLAAAFFILLFWTDEQGIIRSEFEKKTGVLSV